MTKKLTIRDIAKLSKVGKSTVSRVLNNEPGVSEKTRQKVAAVIAEYNFTPSKLARAMSTQNDQVVAIIVTRLSSHSENAAVTEMLPLFYQHGFDPLVMESNFCAERVAEHLKHLSQREISGIIIFGFSGLDETILTPWREKLVLLAKSSPQLSSVSYDDGGAITLLMQQLVQQKHRHISFVGIHDADTTTGFARHQAYLDFCARHDIPDCSVQTDLSFQSAFQKTSLILHKETTAIVCATDNQALGVHKYLDTHNLKQIQIASVGNNPLLKFLYPETLCVDFGYSKAGEIAAQQLISLIEKQAVQSEIIIESKLDD